MNYKEALERAKSTPVMRTSWKQVWLTYENNKFFLLHDDGQMWTWKATKSDKNATDWIEAPKPVDEF